MAEHRHLLGTGGQEEAILPVEWKSDPQIVGSYPPVAARRLR